MINYKQCKLIKGKMILTSWIPEEFAHKGKIISLYGRDRSWVDGVYNSRIPEDQVIENSQDYKTQRKASDV